MSRSTMDAMRISRFDLLREIEGNRASHVEEYKEAMIGYREAMVDALTKALGDAEDGKDVDTAALMLSKPTSHEAEYDTVIAMLNLCVDDEVEISREEFDNYVRDNWDWKANWSYTNSTYQKVASHRS